MITPFGKSHRSDLGRRKSIERDSDFSEDFDGETTLKKTLCHIPYNPIWIYMVILLALASSIESFTNCTLLLRNWHSTYERPYYDLIYFGDILWMIHICLLLLSKTEHNLKIDSALPNSRSNAMLIFDILCCLPLELFTLNARLRSLLSLNRPLKIFHILYIFDFHTSLLMVHWFIYVFQFIYKLLYIISFATFTLASVIVIWLPEWFEHNTSFTLLFMFTSVADYITGKGFGWIAYYPYLCILAMLCIMFFTFMSLFCVFAGNITFIFISTAAHKSEFRYVIKNVKKLVKYKHWTPELAEKIECFFDAMWSKCLGYSAYMGGSRATNQRNLPCLFPRSLFAEICLDLSTGLFQHSILFRDMDRSFLTNLSLYVSQEVYLEGHLIWKRQQMKDKLIYIFSGMLQILSEEDGETPVLSLVDGTCLSESCLLIPYRSNYVVKCNNTCVLHILRREDFLKVARKYKQSIPLLNQIRKRYLECERLHEIKKLVNHSKELRPTPKSMLWLKFTLHKLMAAHSADCAVRHKEPNVYVERAIDETKFKNYVFCPAYIGMLVIAEVVQESNDALFVKSTFPYIFKPDTGLVLFWDIFISCLALVAGTVIPYLTLTFENYSGNAYAIIYLFNAIWIIDLLVQMRIAVVKNHRLLTKNFDIVIYKIGTVLFVIDIFSMLPLEVFIGLTAQESIIKYAFLNRILKVARVFKLLGKWESRYNSDPLRVCLVSAIFILLYGIFLLGCIYYSIGHIAKDDFYKILYYTSQLLTRLAHSVRLYTSYELYFPLNCVVLIVICTLLYVLSGLIFSADSFNKMNLWNIQYSTYYLSKALKTVDSRMENYIINFSYSKCLSNYGLDFTHPAYLYEKLPIEWIGSYFQNLYMDHLVKLPCFGGLSKLMIRDLLKNAANVTLFTPNEVIFHSGELQNTIYIHLKGWLEITGNDMKTRFVDSITDLNSLEVLLKIPCQSSVMTQSHCRIICIDHQEMMKVLRKYENIYQVSRPLSGCQDLREKFLQWKHIIYAPEFLEDYNKLASQKFISFSRRDIKYKKVFELQEMIWCFVPYSIPPESIYLKYWEYQRCLCAIISAIIFTTTSLSLFSFPHPISILMILLELSAFLDIIFRCYVCYYNDKGVLVTHPKATTEHYFKNGMLIDVLGALPLYATLQGGTKVIVNFNKLLQLHRYIGFVRFKIKTSTTPMHKIYMFWVLPLVIIVINFASTVLVASKCYDEFYEEFDFYLFFCQKGSLLDKSLMNMIRNEDQIFGNNAMIISTFLEAHLYMFYVLITLFSNISFQGFDVVNHDEMFLVAALGIISFCYDTMFSANAFGFFINEHTYLIADDLKKQHFIKFLTSDNMKPLNSKLMNCAMHQLTRIWHTNETNLHKFLENFPPNIKRDVLYFKFGTGLETSFLVGADDVEPFLRNLLLHSEYKVFTTGGFIQTINDVSSYTKIVVSGSLKLCFSCRDQFEEVRAIGSGSIVGNLEPSEYSRLNMSCIALENVELLFVKSSLFFDVMQYFAGSKKVFDTLQTKYENYIPGTSNFKYKNQNEDYMKGKSDKVSRSYYILFIILNLVGAYFAMLSYLFTVAVSNDNYIYLDPIFDLSYAVAFSMTFFMGFKNRTASMFHIREKNFSRVHFIISLIGGIPLQCLVVLVPWSKVTIYYLYSGLRITVLLRAYFFFNNWNKAIPTAKSIMFTIKLVLYILILVLVIFIVTAISMFCAGFDEDDQFFLPVYREKLVYGTTNYRIEHFIISLYVVLNMFTHTAQEKYYPNSYFSVGILIVFMTLGMGYLSVFNTMIISMVRATRQSQLAYIDKVIYMFSLLKLNDISSILLERANNYVISIWRTKMGMKVPQILDELPEYLKNPIYADIYSDVIERNSIFGLCHFDLKRQLPSKLKLEHYYYGNFIVSLGTIDNTMYWVLKGKVIAVTSHNEVVGTYRSGHCFGVRQGLSDSPHPYSYRVVEQSAIVLSLKKSDWEYLLKFFPASKKIIKHRAFEVMKLRETSDY